jgi:hypothetical protein
MRGQYQWWGIITYVMFGIMFGSVLFSSILIYNYTFRTLEDAHTIVLLNTDSMVNNVNLDMYKKAVNAINMKVNILNHPNNLQYLHPNHAHRHNYPRSHSNPARQSTAWI